MILEIVRIVVFFCISFLVGFIAYHFLGPQITFAIVLWRVADAVINVLHRLYLRNQEE